MEVTLEKLLLIGIGAVIGFLIAAFFLNRTTIMDIVRDEKGRIIQIVEMSNTQPLFGTRVVNVVAARPVESTVP